MREEVFVSEVEERYVICDGAYLVFQSMQLSKSPEKCNVRHSQGSTKLIQIFKDSLICRKKLPLFLSILSRSYIEISCNKEFVFKFLVQSTYLRLTSAMSGLPNTNKMADKKINFSLTWYRIRKYLRNPTRESSYAYRYIQGFN